jgi:hypothetical protein
MMGKALHSVLEQSGDGRSFIKEKRFTMGIGQSVITGQIDSYDRKEKILYDFKTVSIFKLKLFAQGGVDSDWINQVNIYRWLLEENGKTVN